ncbi:hypothetical protein ACFP1Z_32090 [Streptomyces gamaensis]|uniref:Uncharacterized protein n=1 Tax=Streptomyces gamaensis TaxID=1763542 RepID=A0ABW0ZA08_9ACTN
MPSQTSGKPSSRALVLWAVLAALLALVAPSPSPWPSAPGPPAGPRGEDGGPAQIRRFALEPARVRPGEKVTVILSDDRAAPDEDTLPLKSPRFAASSRMRLTPPGSPDDPGCKCDDGATVYVGHVTVPYGTASGTYTVTVVSHHGQHTSTAQLTVHGGTGAGSDAWVPWAAGCGGAAALAVGTVLVAGRRRRRTAPPRVP